LDLQRGQLGQIGKGVVGENGDLVVAEIAANGMPSGELANVFGMHNVDRYLQSGKGAQMAYAFVVNLLDLIGLQIQLRCLGGNAARYLLQLVTRTADHGAGAGAGWRTVAIAQAALAVLAATLEFRVGQVLDLHVTYLRRGSTTCRSAVQ